MLSFMLSSLLSFILHMPYTKPTAYIYSLFVSANRENIFHGDKITWLVRVIRLQWLDDCFKTTFSCWANERNSFIDISLLSWFAVAHIHNWDALLNNHLVLKCHKYHVHCVKSFTNWLLSFLQKLTFPFISNFLILLNKHFAFFLFFCVS